MWNYPWWRLVVGGWFGSCSWYSGGGLASLGLSHTYPHNADGSLIPHSACQPIGKAVLDAGLDGVDYRSAAAGGDRELAWFPRAAVAQQRSRRTFDDWW